MKKIYLILLFALFAFDTNSEDFAKRNVNELSLSIALTSNGTFGEASGLHTVIFGNPGKNVKAVRLTDDDLKKDHAISLDYYRKIKDNLHLNAGITHSRMSVTPISATFVVGGHKVDPAPSTDIKGFTFNLGPSYRFNNWFNLTTYVGFNISYFDGVMTDTNYPQFTFNGILFGNPNHKGKYGIGGPDTDFTCWGLNPKVGVFSKSGSFKGFGISAKTQNLDCKGDSFRSFRWGYKVPNLKNTFYQIEYRLSF